MCFFFLGVNVLNFRPVDNLFRSRKSNSLNFLVLSGNNIPPPAELHLSPKAELSSQQHTRIKLLRTVLLFGSLLVTKCR